MVLPHGPFPGSIGQDDLVGLVDARYSFECEISVGISQFGGGGKRIVVYALKVVNRVALCYDQAAAGREYTPLTVLVPMNEEMMFHP